MLTRQTRKNKYNLRIVGLNASESILLVIIQAGENGISGNDLELRSGISRITIWKLRDRLRDSGLIYYQTRGRRTMYYPTKLAINNLYFRSWTRYNQLFDLLNSRRIPVSSPFYDFKFPNYFDYKSKIAILEFVLRIGILLTYILLQHLSPVYNGKLNRNQRAKARGITNELIEESVRKIISPVKMLTILRQTLYSLNYRFPISSAKKSDNYSFYLMDSKSFDDVITAFSEVFPQAYKVLQTINFEDAEHRTKQRIEHSKKRREQLKCEHKYKIEITDNIESYYCSICEFAPPKIDRDVIIDHKELVQKLNTIRPPNDTCRNHRWKLWSERMPFVLFGCSLCYKIAQLPIESKEKLDAIKEEVEIDDRLDLKNSVGICEDIELFFHRHSNQRLTVDHYIRYYKKRYFTRKIVDLKVFTTEIETIYEILSKNGYIKRVKINKGIKKLLEYIRRENVEVKSVTGKKLLTLSTV
jgi:biotin operon repressor